MVILFDAKIEKNIIFVIMKKRKMRRKYEREIKSKGYTERNRTNYDRKQPTYDYLKYFRIVRYWAKRTHGVGLADIEMLFFLYSEKLFKRTDFNEYEEIFSWDVNRFQALLSDGWISVWRKPKGSEASLYEVSYKGKRLMVSIYKKLSGEEKISETAQKNPIFKKDSPYTDKVYRRAIKEMNISTTQQQHHAQE
tara:strand:+ start:4117 stop:4698 length:582 start_codon:yes stop_codon:yes gene_type:complete